MDDDELVRDFYVRILESQGFQTDVAQNGEIGRKMLEENNDYALAVIDLVMPVCNGWELIQHIRATDKMKDLPIIAISGMASTFEDFEKIKKNCNDVMLKGEFEISRFHDSIDRILGAST